MDTHPNHSLETTHNDDSTRVSESAPELDRMLGRAVAGDRDAMLWIRMRAATEPAILEELVLWQADELRVTRTARELCARADRVDALPSNSMRARRVGLGWAVAAVLAIALAGQFASFVRTPPATQQRAIAAGMSDDFASTDEAFDAYVAKARTDGALVGEVAPPTLVRSRELGNGGGFEVIVIRQVYERRTLGEMYRIVPTGETGELRPVVIRARTTHAQ